MAERVRDYAIFAMDKDGHIASWNVGAALIKQYRADEIIGKHFSVFYTPQDIERKWPEHELRQAAQEGRFEDEGWRVRKDGSRFWANVIITALRDDKGILLGYSKITRDLSARKRQEEAKRESDERFRLLGKASRTMRSTCSAPRSGHELEHGVRAASRAIRRMKSSAGTFRPSTGRRTSRPAGPGASSHRARAGARGKTRLAAAQRTARISARVVVTALHARKACCAALPR